MDDAVSNHLFLQHVLYVLRTNKLVMFLAFTSTLAGICLGTYLTLPLYEAKTRILIHTNPKQEIALFPDLVTPGEKDTKTNFATDLIQILTSEQMAYTIVDRFRLDHQMYERHNHPQELRDQILYYARQVVKELKKPLITLGLLEDQEDNYRYKAMKDFLDHKADIQLNEDSRVIGLTVWWGPDPTEASAIVNTMAALLEEQTMTMTTSQARVAYEFVREEVEKARQKYVQAQQALEQFQRDNRIVSFDEEKKVKVNQIENLRFERTVTRVSLTETESKLEEAKSQFNRYGERIAGLRSQLIDLEIQRKGLVAKEASLAGSIAELQKELTTLPKKEQELVRLQNAVQIYQGLYNTQKDKLEKLAVLRENKVNEYGLITFSRSDLEPNVEPDWPSWVINLGVGVPLSLLVGFFFPFLIEYWRNPVRLAEDVEVDLELPLLAVIPDLNTKRRALLPHRATEGWLSH